ncbi:MAG: DUF2931 family protein [Saprospiraceae bacterium]
MKLPLLLTVLVLLTLLGAFLYAKNIFTTDKKYNWTLELTKPLDYELSIQNINYYKADKEIFRHTTMNNFSGWSGGTVGRILHNKLTDFLPDSVTISWKETETGLVYSSSFRFPKDKIIAYSNANYALLRQKYGKDYPEGQISLKLGIAPSGLLSLWFADQDINTSGFAMQVAVYRATVSSPTKAQQTVTDSIPIIANKRFGTPQFYTFEGENVVALHVLYHNGETNSINLKNETDSHFVRINQEQGYGLAKRISVHWFDKDGRGYRSTYELALEEVPTSLKDASDKFQQTKLIYLLDRVNRPDAAWNKLTDKHIFQLKEVKRRPMK